MKPGYDGYSPGTYGIASTMQPLYLHISSINGTIVQSGTIPALERATHSWAPNGTILAFYRPSTAHEAEQVNTSRHVCQYRATAFPAHPRASNSMLQYKNATADATFQANCH